MTSLARQIVSCYDINEMSPVEIAQEFELEEAAVIATLTQFSAKYRKDTKVDGEPKKDLDFNDEQLSAVNQVLFDLAVGSDDPNLQFRAARFIRQDKKGRLDKQAFKGLNINVLVLNDALQKANAALERGRSKVIEIPTQ